MQNESAWGNIIVGSFFGSWEVLENAHQSNHMVLCRCSCGKELRINSWHLKNGRTKSCQICAVKRTMTKHGATLGRQESRLYKLWKAMKWRCNERNKDNDYFERGIAVCDEWVGGFVFFRDWSLANGYTDELTLDRIDNYSGYSPSNCRWVDHVIQMNNTRVNRKVTAWGETKTVAEWSRDHRCSVNMKALRRRLNLGWPPAKAIATPLLVRPLSASA